MYCEKCDHVAVIRPADDGRWVVMFGNWSRMALNKDLAEVMAARINSRKGRSVAREEAPVQGLSAGVEPSSPVSGAAVLHTLAAGEEEA